MTEINYVIEKGKPIPADVTGVRDTSADEWTLRANGLWSVAEVDEGAADVFADWPAERLGNAYRRLIVTAVREPEPVERKLIGPPHAHLDAPCTDECFEPERKVERAGWPDQEAKPEPPALLDLVRQYGVKSYETGFANARNDVDGAQHLVTLANALFDRIAALVPQQPDVEVQLTEALEGFAADREYLRAEVERLKNLIGEEDQPGWGDLSRAEAIAQAEACNKAARHWCDEHDKRRDERDAARAELHGHLDSVDRLAGELNDARARVSDLLATVAASENASALVELRAERDEARAEVAQLKAELVEIAPAQSDPSVLSLPEVPPGTVALVVAQGRDEGKRYIPVPGTHYWNAPETGGDARFNIVELLVAYERLTVVKQEPRTWPKLDDAPADLRAVRGTSGRVYHPHDGQPDARWYFEDDVHGRLGFESFAEIQYQDGPLTEVFEDEQGGTPR